MTIVKKVHVTRRRYGFIKILVVALAITGSGIGITQLTRAYRGTPLSTTGSSPEPSFVQYQDANEEVTLRLNPDGFVPAVLTRGAGPFQLSVDNRSGVEEMTLILTTSNGAQVRELRIPRGGGDWSEVLDLGVGTYVLTVADHTNWVCTINVQ